MEMIHIPVMLKEVVDYLNIRPNGIYIDATVGLGGHAGEILKRLKDGLLIGFDKDSEEIAITEKKLKEISSNFILVNESYEKIPEFLEKKGIKYVDGIFFDLGLSSYQLEISKRGFSFKRLDEPLDMRFSKDENLTAEYILNNYSVNELERVFRDYGEEPYYRKLAMAICEERKKKAFKKVEDLVSVVEKIIPKKGRIHPATRAFQALRIEVNKELKVFENTLHRILPFIRKGGRLVVISYHSLEDRIIKNFLKDKEKEGEMEIITKKVLRPSYEEIRMNQRARSAKMRVGEKT
ncbi:MAG: 16S rRNA (cytosine(1402)-N(4))-methyltransferase [Dictyoglomus sp. NZ13-RE01]|nr:MAG: 16S rRNA (cytosine(1402)-N(4))-methyltransferase [Dictyoglomus sp. NZ13-RE01]